MRIVRDPRLTRNRLCQFIAAYFYLLEAEPRKAPTPTRLNIWMGRKALSTLDGRYTRWRNFLLLETGFMRDPRSQRWKRPAELDSALAKLEDL